MKKLNDYSYDNYLKLMSSYDNELLEYWEWTKHLNSSNIYNNYGYKT